ncbi:MAG TPA: hypothetical protein VE988_14825 [Gemmataceae bacterium]|nr:hypothetical protein [Gemmataceae bacterium]
MFATSLVVLSLLSPATPANTDYLKMLAKADFIAEKPAADLSGYYTCEGQEGPDKRYKGIAIITKIGDAYMIQWVIGAGTSYSGVGIRNDNVLSAGWALPQGDKGLVRGITVYRVEPGQRLVGRWVALPGEGTIRTETLTFLKKLEAD